MTLYKEDKEIITEKLVGDAFPEKELKECANTVSKLISDIDDEMWKRSKALAEKPRVYGKMLDYVVLKDFDGYAAKSVLYPGQKVCCLKIVPYIETGIKAQNFEGTTLFTIPLTVRRKGGIFDFNWTLPMSKELEEALKRFYDLSDRRAALKRKIEQTLGDIDDSEELLRTHPEASDVVREIEQKKTEEKKREKKLELDAALITSIRLLPRDARKRIGEAVKKEFFPKDWVRKEAIPITKYLTSPECAVMADAVKIAQENPEFVACTTFCYSFCPNPFADNPNMVSIPLPFSYPGRSFPSGLERPATVVFTLDSEDEFCDRYDVGLPPELKKLAREILLKMKDEIQIDRLIHSAIDSEKED